MHKVDLKTAQSLDGQLREWAYNALDVTGTLEIYQALEPRLDDHTRTIYQMEKAVMRPAMAMSRRGVRVNTIARAESVAEQKRAYKKALASIGKMEEVQRVWDGLEKVTGKCKASSRKDGKHTWEKGVEDTPDRKCVSCGASRFQRSAFNPGSPDQVKHLFYDLLGAKVQYDKDGKVSTGEDALMRIGKQNPELAKITDAIIEARGLKKQIGFLEAKLTPDNRYPSSFNVGTAWTGRWSSSKDAFGRGGNLQNIAERHRRIFIPDTGFEICYADLKQAESNMVAHLAGDEVYIEAHASGDVHTYVTRLVWPDMPWTGDLKKDKAIAKQNPPWDQAPGHDYRFQSKRIQHGSLPNYMEVLTFSGWKPIGIVGDTERIAVWHSEGTITYEIPSRWTRYPYEGDLVRFDGRYLKQDTTPNHRMPHFNNGKLGEKKAEQFPLKYGRFPVHGVLHGGGGPTPDEARLIAAYWADGHARPYGSMASFTKNRKVERMRELLQAVGIQWEERVYREGQITFVWKKVTRKHLGYDMLNWSLPARKALLDELPYWDGHTNPKTGQKRIFQVNREDLEIIASIAAISGFRGSIYKHGNPKDNEQQSWAIGLHTVDKSDYSRVPVSNTFYSGLVHSPTVSSGWFLTRKDGVVSITGNSNYGLSPFGIAMIAKIPLKAAKEAFEAYHEAFPHISAWQARVKSMVENQEALINPLGRKVSLFGRPWDPHTYKQGLAFLPQSAVADIINIGVWRVWQELETPTEGELLQLLAQVHDAILFQFRAGDLNIVHKVMELMSVPVPVTDIYGKTRIARIETEAAVGGNWGHRSDDNPKGILEI